MSFLSYPQKSSKQFLAPNQEHPLFSCSTGQKEMTSCLLLLNDSPGPEDASRHHRCRTGCSCDPPCRDRPSRDSLFRGCLSSSSRLSSRRADCGAEVPYEEQQEQQQLGAQPSALAQAPAPARPPLARHPCRRP